MKLLVDAGNTAVKMMLAHDDDTLGAVSLQEVPWAHVEEVLVSAVADSSALTQLLAIAAANGKTVHRASTSALWQQLHCAYDNYKTLGIDRWLAVIAGYGENPSGYTVVVDAGTALTIDVINDKHQHLGGYILSGLKLSEQSIVNRAQNVFSVEGLHAQPLPGESTPEAVKNGAFIAALGAIEYVVQHTCKEQAPMLLITGGDGLSLHMHLPHSTYRPHLVLEGLLRWREGR
ncbi:type III pantothenate kinase [Pseudoalteromonas sp. SSDWG2]|uniref:type III pantothenate kinase n=1 Tax=Pseudoalteromonas sp. SSDWG2 TaxID=3139391 RepID=UPI003BA8B02C